MPCAKRVREVEDIVAVRSARPVAATNLLDDLLERRVAEERDIVGGCMVGHAAHISVVQLDRKLDPPIAVLLAMIEMLEHCVFDQERFALANLTGRFNQRHDAARIGFRSAMIVRTLPKAA